MRLLFVAPEICTPVTEGRKRFIIDLLVALSGSDQVFLLTTRAVGQSLACSVPTRARECRWPPEHLLYLRTSLPQTLQRFEADAVFHFPYGTFHSIYGIANRWIIRAIDTICGIRKVPCATVMYSIDRPMTLKGLSTVASCVIAVKQPTDDTFALPLGINDAGWAIVPSKENASTILFMAGMWQTKRERVDHVLHLRGLGTLLRAGATLGSAGIRLIAASPVFENPGLKEYVLHHFLNRWPTGHLELRGAVKIPEVYHEAALYIFPYQHSITQFTPTSVIEAMMAGTPVVMSDLPFLRELAQGGSMAYMFPPDDEEGLAAIVLKALGDPEGCRARAQEARRYAQKKWSILVSVEETRRIAQRLRAKEKRGIA
jgi:glycosyltransferase involved in cell wall biosynthesis